MFYKGNADSESTERPLFSKAYADEPITLDEVEKRLWMLGDESLIQYIFREHLSGITRREFLNLPGSARLPRLTLDGVIRDIAHAQSMIARGLREQLNILSGWADWHLKYMCSIILEYHRDEPGTLHLCENLARIAGMVETDKDVLRDIYAELHLLEKAFLSLHPEIQQRTTFAAHDISPPKYS
jgi:hypothetical protein